MPNPAMSISLSASASQVAGSEPSLPPLVVEPVGVGPPCVAFGTPATYVLNNPPTLASVGASDITSTASGLVELGRLTLGVVGSAVVEVTARIHLNPMPYP